MRGYLSYYKFHLTVLARVVASVQKAEPIDEAIAAVKSNFEEYLSKVGYITSGVREDVPLDPLKEVSAAQRLLAVLGVAQLSRPLFDHGMPISRLRFCRSGRSR